MKTSEQLVEELKEIELQERDLEEVALLHLTELYRRKYHLEVKCPNLFEFCVKHLGYSNGKASRRVSSLKCLEALSDEKQEEVYEQLKTGALNLTHLVQVQSVSNKVKLTQDQREKIIDELIGTSTRESERVLAAQFGVAAVQRETFRPITETDTKVSLVLDQETLDLLEQFKNLTAHQNPNGSSALALKLALKIALQKKDPAQKPVPAPERISASTQRVARGTLRAAVWKKDRGRCSVCSSNYMLEVDHIIPHALGGKTKLSNLRLLCRAHHQARR